MGEVQLLGDPRPERKDLPSTPLVAASVKETMKVGYSSYRSLIAALEKNIVNALEKHILAHRGHLNDASDALADLDARVPPRADLWTPFDAPRPPTQL